jgi:trehalose 6-phosphate synthase
LVNPYDKIAVAQALKQALAMPLENRRARHERMLEALHKNSIARWHGTFVAALTGTSDPSAD